MRRYCLTSMDARTCAPILDRRVALCRDARSVRPSPLDRRVTLCRDARSVRPSPLKVTALKLKDNGLYVSSFDNGRPPVRRFRASLLPSPPHFHYPYDLLHF